MPRILRACALAIVVVATFEICARVSDRVVRGSPVLQLEYTVPPLYAYDATGPHGIPNAHDGKFTMNSLGFRGPELEDGRETILCLGASETFGIAESGGHEYPRLLEAQLNAGGLNRYQVVNAALPGQRLEDVVTTLPGIIRKSKPEYAIIYPTPGSVIWTRRQWDSLHPTVASKDPPPEHLSRFRIRERLQTAIQHALPPFIEGRFEHHGPVSTVLTGGAPPRAHLPQSNIDGFRTELESVVAALMARHVQPILVTHATRFGPDGRYRDEQLVNVLVYYPVVTAAGLIDTERRMNDVIRATGRRHNIPVVDAADRIPPGRDDFSDFFHFTDVGSEKMAALLAAAVRTADRRTAGEPRGV